MTPFDEVVRAERGMASMASLTFYKTWGSGCGSVGRAVTSNSRGPQFESSHWQKIILHIYCQLYSNDENKERRVREWPIFDKKNLRETD